MKVVELTEAAAPADHLRKQWELVITSPGNHKSTRTITYRQLTALNTTFMSMAEKRKALKLEPKHILRYEIRKDEGLVKVQVTRTK